MKQSERWVVGLGEVLWDMLPDGKQLGGAPANFAFHVQSLGLPSVVVSAVGGDALGDEAAKVMAERGLNTYIARVSQPTGVVEVTLAGQGVPSYDIKEGVAWDNIPYTPAVEEVARNCRAVCFGSLAQRSLVSHDTICSFLDAVPHDCLKIFDINLRQHFYSRDIIEESLQRCNILKINDEEIAIVARLLAIQVTSLIDIAHQLIATYSLDLLILTCGVAGSYVLSTTVNSYLPTPQVDVVDTVGAGDSFTGAFCYALLSGLEVEQAHRLAVDVSAFVCTQHGAMPPLPDTFICNRK